MSIDGAVSIGRPGAGPESPASGTSGASLRMLLAGSLGNTLEWYDFAAYGFLASIFARNFFPASDHVVSLIAAFGVFAASFLMRPLGGIVFGHIGDRYGRRLALYISAGVMTVSTVVIGFLPTYDMVGGLAPVLLLLLRLAQGVSIGGEYTASAIFLGESSAPRWRGFLTSLTGTGATAGTLLGSAVGAATASVLSADDMVAWGWRVPFLLGVLLGGFTLLLRGGLKDEEKVAPPAAEAPLVVAFRADGRNIVRAVALNVMLGVGFYLLFVYLTTYMHQVDGLPERQALQVNTSSMLLLVLLLPAFAALSDVIGRKPVIIAALALIMLLSWPLFRMISAGSERDALLGQWGFAVLMAAYMGPMPVTLVEMFNRATRCSAVSVGYNLSIGVAGGTAPMVAVYLVNRQHDDMGPAVYIILVAAISLIAAFTLTDRARKPLP